MAKAQDKSDFPGDKIAEEKKAGTAVAVYDFGNDAGAGMEDIKREEYAMPIWRVVQSNSKAVKDVEMGGVEGARAGMLINLGTGEIYKGKEGVDFVPVYREHVFIERQPVEGGGTPLFVGVHEDGSDLVLSLLPKAPKFGPIPTPTGTQLYSTFSFYGIFLSNTATDLSGTLGRGMISFASTQIGKYQRVISLLDSPTMKYPAGENKPLITPPLWAHRWHLSTAPEKNKKGEYYGLNMTLKVPPEPGGKAVGSLIKRDSDIYLAGREFYDLIKAGKAKGDYAGADNKDETDENDIPM